MDEAGTHARPPSPSTSRLDLDSHMMPSIAVVRTVRTIQPARSDRMLTAAHCRDACSGLVEDEAIVVELGWRDWETEAARYLAWYAIEGHPITIRGKRHENALKRFISTLIDDMMREAG